MKTEAVLFVCAPGHFLVHFTCVLYVPAVFLEEMSRVFTPPQAAAENTVFKWSEHWAGSQLCP